MSINIANERRSEPAQAGSLDAVVSVQPAIHSGCTYDCLDLDDECVDVKDPLHCYQHDPKRGLCPLLRHRQN